MTDEGTLLCVGSFGLVGWMLAVVAIAVGAFAFGYMDGLRHGMTVFNDDEDEE